MASSLEREPVLEFGETLNQTVADHLNDSQKIYYLGASKFVFATNKEELDEMIIQKNKKLNLIKPIEKNKDINGLF
ncbi:hypothetical protein [Paenibacillus herberti]|uniref:Uncharacterized protein n=1 Tax=Paenibacillus herberti TaxID=1619309 RepID=A0A229NW87_9BACL|nr:hypothetical protein [Paenibacillus herberti]OXM13909.1 hypothetical protein CGZ75_12920 [Paenibacillus herberti]